MRASLEDARPLRQASSLHEPRPPRLLPSPRQEGFFDPSGAYIEYEREDEQDAWLDSIEGEHAAASAWRPAVELLRRKPWRTCCAWMGGRIGQH